MHRTSSGASRRRIAATLVAFVALGTLASACSSDDRPTASSVVDSDAASSASGPRPAPCRPVPAQGAALSWSPTDLPLPPGSYPIQDVDASAAPPTVESETHRGLIAVHATIDDFVTFINTQWTGAGWTLGRGDS